MSDSGTMPTELFTPQDEGDSSAAAPSGQGSETTEQKTPVAEGETQQPGAAESQPKTYKYGDRELSADDFYKEVTENLLPDYTRKSQELARKGETQQQDQTINNEQKKTERPWQDPNWQPKTYQEFLDAAADRIRYDAEQAAAQEDRTRQEIAASVDTELAEVKKLEPSIDETALFTHANKYGFTNLVSAFKNMQDMQAVVKQTQAETVENLKKRDGDTVATGTGDPSSDGIDYGSIQGRGVYEAAQEHFARIRK